MVTAASSLSLSGNLTITGSFDEVSLTSGSLSFNGTSQYLTAPANTAYAFGTGDFTIEAWVYLTAVTSTRFITNRLSNVGSNGTWSFRLSDTATTFTEVITGEPGPGGSFSSILNTWTHVAVSRSSGTTQIFIGGVSVVSASQTTNFNNSSYVLNICTDPGGFGFTPGNVSNVRIVKGTAVYTSNFTPPSLGLDAIANTSLLLAVTDATNFIKDNSTNNFTLTNVNTVAFNSSTPFQSSIVQHRPASGSLSFDGTSQYLTVPSNAAFTMGTGDWTVEAWIYLTTAATNGAATTDKLVFGGFNFTPAFFCFINNSTIYRASIWNGTTQINSNITILPNVWTHVAWVRQSSTLNIYTNGVSGSTTAGYTTNWTASTSAYIGRADSSVNRYFPGYITNLRVVKGTAVYTTAFTPPTTPLTAVTNTSLLLAVTDATNFIRDNSTNNFTLTNVNTVAFNSSTPFQPSAAIVQHRLANDGTIGVLNSFDEVSLASGSLRFNGIDTYLSVPSTGLALSGNQFTIECWVYLTGYSLGYTNYYYSTIFNTMPSGSTGLHFSITGTASTYTGFQLYAGSGAINNIASTYSFQLSTWYHVALTRATGGVFVFYVNGVNVGTFTDTSTWTDSTPYGIGRNNQNNYEYYFPGYISNFRIVIAAPVYTSNFTPPALGLAAIANTSLLLSVLDSTSYITDSSGNNRTITDPTAVQFDTNSPFTGLPLQNTVGSLNFNGTTRYLTVPDSASQRVGTNDFTIEAWVYFTTSDTNPIYSKGTDGNEGIFMGVQNSTNLVTFQSAGTDLIVATTAVVINQWTHIAVSRAGTSLRLFINGLLESTVTNSTNFSQTAAGRIGRGRGTSTNYWRGRISNFRLVIGTAVYTASFTPSSPPLTAIANTQLLLTTNNSATPLADSSTNNVTLTNNGSITYNADGPVWPYVTGAPILQRLVYDGTLGIHGRFDEISVRLASSLIAGSLSFNGTSQYLSIASNASLALGSGDFTVEWWGYLNLVSLPTNATVYDHRNGTNGVGVIQPVCEITSANGMTWYVTATNRITSGTAAIKFSTWQHFTICRASGTTKMFIDGTQVGSSYTDANNYPAGSIFIGKANDGVSARYFTGYISNFRIVKGTAVYTTAFTPPTTPLTAITNTALFLNTTNDSNALLDSSTNSVTVTNNGTITGNAANPFSQYI